MAVLGYLQKLKKGLGLPFVSHFLYDFSIKMFFKVRGHAQHFSFTCSKKMLQHFFFGKCYLWCLLATCCNFRLLQQKNVATFVQQNQISLILLQFICNIFNVLPDMQPEIFQGRGGFVELGHFDKLFIKNKKKAPQGKILELFLLDTLKTTF